MWNIKNNIFCPFVRLVPIFNIKYVLKIVSDPHLSVRIRVEDFENIHRHNLKKYTLCTKQDNIMYAFVKIKHNSPRILAFFLIWWNEK